PRSVPAPAPGPRSPAPRIRSAPSRESVPAVPEKPRLSVALRWQSLVQEFTGGDPQIAARVKQMYQKEPAMQQRSGIDPAMFEYIRKASRDA
ncbi:MAG: hypothetical protein ACRENP_09000, partial [Longimicrobiales bacterium]